jgi:endonuclease/exonuclease/phosphatase family metal-dependent hydrolase
MDAATDPLCFPRRRAKDAVLARPPWRIVEHRQERFAGSARFYPRGAIVARLARPDTAGLWAVSTHVGLRPLERLHHARELLTLVGSLAPGTALVLGGDLNELPDGKAVALLGTRLTDVWQAAGAGPGSTIPSDAPNARIDYLFAGPRVEVRSASVPAGPFVTGASDHLPLVAEIELA